MQKPAGQVAAEQQQESPMYTCAECGEPVILFDGLSFRTCDHHDAAIHANLTAIVKGQSGLQ